MTPDPSASLRAALATPSEAGQRAGDALQGLVRAAREHLAMDVSFISEFSGGDRVFRVVDSAGKSPVAVGGSDPLEASYCQRVVDGRLPELIRDAGALPAAAELPVTAALPVGAHMSVPLRLSDGRVYGTFCCFRHDADETLTDRDLAVLRVFADVASSYLDADITAADQREQTRRRVLRVIDDDDLLVMVFQPVVATQDGRVLGVEALARFPVEIGMTPDVWFADAEAVGLGVELEMTAVRNALRALAELPDDVFLGVNVSPAVAESADLRDVLAAIDVSRIVLEMTEHAPVDDYARLKAALQPMRDRGLRIAVDDAGAGYASLRHILWLAPDFIKLDISITRDIDTDIARAALASALIEFAAKVGSGILAEGVETQAELDTIRALGAGAAQGYYLMRPGTLAECLAATATAVS
jgi:EAL domain-containing protein (putative c-di-GMP-specific phosphodiesterase class I)